VLVSCDKEDIPVELTDQEILELILETIEIPEETITNIELLNSYTYENHTANATWRTTSSSIMTFEGIIGSVINNTNVVLILTLEYNGVTVTKNYDITVIGNSDYLILYAIITNLVSIPTEIIYENITLPSSYSLDKNIVQAVWSSSNEEVLSSKGIVKLGSEVTTINLFLTLSFNGIIREEVYEVQIGQDPSSLPINWWHNADVYNGVIENEESKPYVPSCFSGAIYRKVISSRDYWLGIEGIITLPEFIPDSERYDETKPSYYLDNASIYLGGNAYKESDVGLTWSIGYEETGTNVLSSEGIAFRPFWRYITNLEDCTNNNCYKNADVSEFEYYYYPGDTIQISVISPAPGYLQMRIELLELTEHPDYINKRTQYGLASDFNRVFTTDPFPSAGMGVIKTEFKRVNAIDQVSNEGKPTINTNAKVINAIWQEVYLYRVVEDILYKIPLISERRASMVCPLGVNENGDFTDTFSITYEGVNGNLGGEIISIIPDNGDGMLYNTVVILPRKKEYYTT